MRTYSSYFSTSKLAWKVSCTRQTTTAAISIGLPRLSLTFSLSPLRFLARSEIRFLVFSGFVQCQPAWRTEPRYAPKRINTRPSLGCKVKNPLHKKQARTNTSTALSSRYKFGI